MYACVCVWGGCVYPARAGRVIPGKRQTLFNGVQVYCRIRDASELWTPPRRAVLGR